MVEKRLQGPAKITQKDNKKVLTWIGVFFCVAFVFLAHANSVSAVAYTSFASGVWSTTTNWSPNGNPGSASGDTVNIGNHQMQVTATPANTITSINFTASGASISVDTGITLTVTTLTQNNLAAAIITGTITGAGNIATTNVAVGNGTAATGNNSTYIHKLISSVNSLTVSSNLTINSYFVATNRVRNGTFEHQSGTVAVTGAVVTANANAANTSLYTMAVAPQTGTLDLSGATPWTISPTDTSTTTLTGTSATIKYSGTGQTARVTSYTNLTLSGSGTKTFATTPTVNGTLSMEGTADIAVTTGFVTYGSAATLQYNKSGSYTTTTKEFITPFIATGGVIIANSGTITLDGAKQFGNNTNVPLTINNGASLATGNYGLTFHGNFVNSGTLTAGSSTVTIAGTTATQNIGPFTTTGTVSMTKTGGTATFTGAVTSGALAINGSGGALNLGTSLSHQINGNVTLTTGTLNTGTSSLSLTGDWSMAATNPTFTPGSNTVTFNGTGAQSILGTATSQTFYGLIVAKTAGQTLSVSGSTTSLTVTNFTETTGNFTASATMDINGNIILTAGTYTAGTTTTVFGNWTNNGGTFTPGTNTVTFDGTSTQTIQGTSDSQTFYNVILSKTAGQLLNTGGSTITMTVQAFTETTGNFTAPATMNINGTLTLTDGTYTAGANTYIKGDWTKATAATFTNNSGVVNFTGTGAQAINGTSTSQTFYGLIVAKTVGQTLTVSGSTTTLNVTNFTETTGNFTAPATINISGTVTLSTGTYTAGTNTNMSGSSWANNGATFTAGTGTVTFNGSTQSISGDTTFYGLAITGTVARAVTFAGSSTTSIATNGFLTLTGSAGQTLTLLSSNTNDWNLQVSSTNTTVTVTNVTVSHSNATGFKTIVATDATNTDGGNNTNWLFRPTKIIYTNANRTITSGTCSGAGSSFSIQLQDSANAAMNPISTTVVRVTSNSTGTFTVYSDNTCITPITNGDITFTTSDNSYTFYVKDTRKSNPTWTQSSTRQSGDTLTTGTQTYTVSPGSVTKLVVTLPGQTFADGSGNSGGVTNQTAGNSFNIVSLSATDDYFNVNTSYFGTKTLAYSGPNNAPDIPPTPPSYITSVDFTSGQSTTTLATILYKAEATTITVTEGELYGNVSSSVTVGVGSLYKYAVVVATPQIAGICFTGTNTITAQDHWSNPITSDASIVDMTPNGTGIIFYSSPGCSGETMQYLLSSGQATMYIKTNVKQSGKTVMATRYGGSETGTSNNFTVNPGSVTKLVVTLPGQTFADGSGNSGGVTNQTAGNSFNIVSLSATDDYFNVNTSYSETKTLAYSGPANAPDTTPSSYTTSVNFTSGQSTTTLVTILYKAEATTITVTEGGLYGNVSSSVTVDPGNVSADTNDSTVTGPSGASLNTDITVTITLKDTWRNPKSSVAAANMTIGATATATITQPTNATDANGQTTGLVKWSDTGMKTVNVTISTITLVQNDGITPDADGKLDNTLAVTVSSAGAPTKVVFTNANRTITAGSCSGASLSFTIQLQDAGSSPTNPTGSTTIQITTGSTGTFKIYSDDICSTELTSGNINFTTAENTKTFYMTDTKKSATTWTATAHKTVGPDTITDGTQTYTVNAGSVTRLVITLLNQTFTDGTGNSGSVANQTAGSSFNITKISATDNYFNINTSYGGSKTLTYTGPANAPDTTPPSYTTSVDFTNGQSTTTLVTILYKAEATTVTVTDTGNYGYASSLVTVDPGNVSADTNDSTVTGSSTAYTNNNITITITLKDTWRNPKSSVAAGNMTIGATATATITQPTNATDANGQTTGLVKWSDTGVKTVNVTISTITLVQNDGITPDADGKLDNTLGVTVSEAPVQTTQSEIKGGVQIRGGVKLGQ